MFQPRSGTQNTTRYNVSRYGNTFEFRSPPLGSRRHCNISALVCRWQTVPFKSKGGRCHLLAVCGSPDHIDRDWVGGGEEGVARHGGRNSSALRGGASDQTISQSESMSDFATVRMDWITHPPRLCAE
jgi:hypothetical protein